MIKKYFLLIFLLLEAAYWMDLSYAARSAYNPKGRRDPFLPLVSRERQVIAAEDIVSINDVSLEGLAIGKLGKRVAIINGIMLKEGERIGNVEVKTITYKSVKVLIDSGEYELHLPEEGG